MTLGDAIRAMKETPDRTARVLPTLPPVPAPEGVADPVLAEKFRTRVLDWIGQNPNPSGAIAGYLRSSSLYKLCARREAILNVRPELDEEAAPSLGMRLTVDVGSAMHDWWQNKYLGPAQLLHGLWFCHRCQTTTWEGLMPHQCPKCGVGRDSIKYEEYALKDDTLRYGGHPDGLLALGRPKKTLFELKSISGYGYDHLEEPDPEHKAQTHAYMRLTGVDDVLIVYVNRAKLCEWSVRGGKFFAGRPNVKVFHIVFDPEYWAHFEGRIREYWRARALMSKADYIDMDDVRTFNRVCSGRSSPLARGCPACDTCFREEAP